MKPRKIIGVLDFILGALILSVNYRILHGDVLPEKSGVVLMALVTVLGLILILSSFFLFFKE